MTTLHLKNSVSRSPWRGGFLLIPLMLTCFALLPSAQAFTTDPDDTFTNFNTAAGLQALLANTGLGPSNTAYGARALKANTIGGSNVGIGGFALINNIDGDMNTAVGNNAMFSNQHGDSNMALGQGALGSNVSGSRNVAMGAQALAGNTASGNTAVGFQALGSNTTGGTVVEDGLGANTAIGSQALVSNKTGSNNNAVGFNALFTNNGDPAHTPFPQGSFNNAHGNFALFFNTTGAQNNAFGDQALINNVTGNFNTAIGDRAGRDITTNWNIDIGKDVFGDPADGSFVTRIGISAVANGLRQKKCFIGGIADVTLAAPFRFVVINAAGQLGAVEDLNAVTSNEFLKEHQTVKALKATVEKQEAIIAQQQKGMEVLTAQLKEQAAQIQKVSAQLEVSKPAPQVVKNP